jgi:uncharacterized membrane protein YphA (DoxX/SURF4 family)
MDYLILIARILFAGIFIMSGVGHLTQASAMTQYAGSKGLPVPKLFVILTGLMIILGGISVIFGAYTRIGAMLLVLFLLPTAFIMHNFWTLKDPMQRINDQAHFLKDIALAGGAFIIWYFGSGPFSLTQ